MAIWDNMKKFTQPYADDEDEYADDYEEEGTDYEDAPEESTRRFSRRTAAHREEAPVNDAGSSAEDHAESSTGFGSAFGFNFNDNNSSSGSTDSAAGSAEPAGSTASSGGAAPAAAERKQVPYVHRPRTPDEIKQKMELFCPENMEDVNKAADALLFNKAVVINLEHVSTTLSTRVVDILSGCIYALGGSMTKVAETTYVFTPRQVEMTGKLPEPLASEAQSYAD